MRDEKLLLVDLFDSGSFDGSEKVEVVKCTNQNFSPLKLLLFIE